MAQIPEHLPDTAPLLESGAFGERMVAGISALLDAELQVAAAVAAPATGGPEPSARRRELARRIGVVDARLPVPALELVGSTAAPSLVARAQGYEVHAVRWPVLPGVDGEGLLLRPCSGTVRAHVVVLPDADLAPEALAGLGPGLPPEAQVARRLAEAGCQVVVPVLIDRGGRWAEGRPHREYVWRMAFEVGRHIIGYEVQKVLALVDHFTSPTHAAAPVGVYGYGEGGLIALHAAALDARIAAAAVSGHFRNRGGVWREPIDRDVWGLLRHGFGDAGLAALVAPRGLLVEAVPGPVVTGPPSGVAHSGGLSSGSLGAIPPAEVRAEVARARPAYAALEAADRLVLVEPPAEEADAGPGTAGGLAPFLRLLGADPEGASTADAAADAPVPLHPGPDPQARMHRQFRQLCAFTQGLLHASGAARDAYWSTADRSSPERWAATSAPFRQHFHDEVLGRLPPPTLAPNPQSRLRYDRPEWRGYEVTLDLWPGVFAQGILLVPSDLRPGQRRPVVVCQHGLEGRAEDTVEGPPDSPYRGFAARLAERGFITYAPQNPYIGAEAFRVLQRKAHPLQWSLFSFIVAQHQRTLEWLGGLPWVDPARIALYGLSYGGKTAMRVPAVLPGYCLSICSADFNEWAVKCASEDRRFSYLFTPEYDMYEFDLAHTCNYAEMAGLIAPRPFMVERGHRDGVGMDEWVAYEYARVRRLYDEMGLAERTAIDFFVGGHQIHGEATFAFLERHLG